MLKENMLRYIILMFIFKPLLPAITILQSRIMRDFSVSIHKHKFPVDDLLVFFFRPKTKDLSTL